MDALITTYLQDHHAGSSAGLDAVRRVAEGHSEPEVREAVARLADQIEEDQTALEALMERFDAKPSKLKDAVGSLGEKFARLKPNERIADRSPLSDIEELEALVLGVHGKGMLWKAMLDLGDPRADLDEMQRLADRAEAQERELVFLRRSQLAKLLQD